jgi:hypothetical protein
MYIHFNAEYLLGKITNFYWLVRSSLLPKDNLKCTHDKPVQVKIVKAHVTLT